MVFSWKNYPQAVGIALQYIQDHAGREEVDSDWTNMLRKIKTAIGESPCSTLTAPILRTKMQVFVKDHRKNPKSVLRDVFLKGIHVLNFDKTKYSVDLAHDTNEVHTSTSAATQTSTESEGNESISPKPQKTKEFSKAPKRKLSDRGEREGVEHEKLPVKKRQKQTPQQRPIVDTGGSGKSTSIGVPRRNLYNSKETQESPAAIDDTDDDSSTLSDTESVDGEERQEVAEEEAGEQEDAQIDKSEGHQTQIEAVAATTRKVILKVAQNKVNKTNTATSHIPSPYTIADRYSSGQELEDDSQYEYVPIDEGDVSLTYESVKIEDAMKEIAIRIDETLDIELRARNVDGDRPSKLEEELYDQDGAKVLRTIFGYGWDISSLKARINQIQNSRRLPLRTFMRSFVGASVTIHALQPSPQGQINESSVEYRLYVQACEYAGTLGAKTSTSDLAHEHYSDVARGYAVKNFIYKHFIPSIQAKAGQLATELLSQLVVLYPAGVKWRPSNPGWLRPSSYRPDPPGSEPQSAISTIRGVERDVFWHNLKNIFVHALTVRAAMEAAGNAIYDFKFHQFLSDFKSDIMQHNDREINLDEPHRVFVSVLPSVWVRYRNNRTAPYAQLSQCITRGLLSTQKHNLDYVGGLIRQDMQQRQGTPYFCQRFGRRIMGGSWGQGSSRAATDLRVIERGEHGHVQFSFCTVNHVPF